jgi:hypothetical protein
MSALHEYEEARENFDKLDETIAELEMMRSGLEPGELRTSYNVALDRLRVLQSKVFQLHRKGSETWTDLA